ncbi:bifunctional phosphoribosylaminoimidazolecarboxamide formyltransferase/IMP cyclohydrolase [Carboxydothermus ferrireducens]|uniref:Bifunctional purine biosynthesis protein PurH n=1 Tax=Carboxydothermus ferrireducens DSM 11255 TaxID=1119529 RepID=A0ABX2R732_9THEO|nr:bifunctional phosphoribosylaminoimidazolecarboxamide formyltransferase/IMP cyclohydrolase [Carboxydothermus ferrireducens]NYE56973.1 phosphoribosylaminoimidazolecarboxamide formyltransferase/IMP cyclohydrolase [Carboxydothermus ferrireducens DSM 11255]
MGSKRALISVYDKRGIVEFAGKLVDLGFEIISTGGSYKVLKEAGIPVTYVSEITGFPEILEGRVKTLHPAIHGGILAKRTEEHLKEISALAIKPIDLVIVNLYPFRETVARGADQDEIIENIDIGGPTLIRAAAKNHRYVTVVVDPEDYAEVVVYLKKGEVPPDVRERLALKAFRHTASYDIAIANYFAGRLEDGGFRKKLYIEAEQVEMLRYGENPHQRGAVYRVEGSFGLVDAEILNGKAMSFNNYLDADAAYRLIGEFREPAAAIIKHTVPCGVATGENLKEAYEKAYAGDPVSAYGGIVAFNGAVDEKVAELLVRHFYEVIIAPDFSDEALKILREKKNLRVIKAKPLALEELNLRQISGGLLLQENDGKLYEELKVVAGKDLTEGQREDIVFGLKVVKYVKSNAVAVVKDGMLLGAGGGQTSRIDAVKIALNKAGERARGAVVVSDAFFPFADSIEELAKAGVSVVVEPGGAVRDQEVIEEAAKRNVTLVFTGVRHFLH